MGQVIRWVAIYLICNIHTYTYIQYIYILYYVIIILYIYIYSNTTNCKPAFNLHCGLDVRLLFRCCGLMRLSMLIHLHSLHKKAKKTTKLAELTINRYKFAYNIYYTCHNF